jgi:hypothetical protein
MPTLRRLVLALGLPLLALFAIPALPGLAAADGCYICRSGSSCGQYCRYAGRDSFAKRKKCIKAGCKIGGTASCPTAANVRICSGVGSLFDLTPKHAALPQSHPAIRR